MRHLFGSLALLALAVLSGCSGTQRAKTPDEVVSQMNEELAHALSPSDAVGTTSLTNATLSPAASDAILREPMPLPEDRMPLSVLEEPAQATWGAPGPNLRDLPASRD